MDLNEDVQTVICDLLDTFDLLSLAQVNERVFVVVEEVLRRRFIKKWIFFCSPYSDDDHEYAAAYVEEFDDRIEIQHLPTVYTITQTFGHLISKLMIDHENHLPDDQSIHIFQAINLHCSETLRKFHIFIKSGDIFTEFEKPFKSVETVTLNGRFVNWGSSKMSFSEMFPSIKHLQLDTAKIQYENSTNQTLPHLEKFSTDVVGNMTLLTKDLIEDNPEIRCISILFGQPSVLQLVADKLKNLERLTLEYYHEYKVDGNTRFNFHFQNLKKFILRGSIMPTNITFGGKIEELEFQSHENGKWIELVVEHSATLKKLDFLSSLTGPEIEQLASAHLNIVRMRFIYTHAVSIENLFNLIKGCERLKKLELYVSSDELRGSTFDDLKKQWRNQWTVHMTGEYVYLDRN